MIKVRKANVVLQIEDDEVDKYLNEGYSVIGEKGQIVKEGMSTNVHELQKQLIEARQEIAKLIEQIKSLTAKLNEKKAVKKQTKEE